MSCVWNGARTATRGSSPYADNVCVSDASGDRAVYSWDLSDLWDLEGTLRLIQEAGVL